MYRKGAKVLSLCQKSARANKLSRTRRTSLAAMLIRGCFILIHLYVMIEN